MDSQYTYLRVLEHDNLDNIRMGAAFPAHDVAAAFGNVRTSYEAKLAWCGGCSYTASRFYRKIVLVDASTFRPVCTVFNGEVWAETPDEL